MKEIRLIQLKMENFKGMTFSFEPDGSDADIFGQNGKGKTTVADAYFWLLFGKDSLGRTDSGKGKFEIKNLDKDGKAASGLEHAVEGLFNINGTPTTLKRVFREVWSTPRGKAERILTGNTTDYWIDGVPAKENEYKSRIAEIFGDEAVLRLLTSPTAYPSLPWEKRRSLLLEVCGDVSDADVIESDTALAPLAELLERYTVSKEPLENLKKVVTGRKTEIKKKIDELPIRIDEKNRGLPDIKGLDYGASKDEVARLDAAVGAAKLRLQGIDNGSGIADLSKQLQVVKFDVGQLENQYYLGGMKHVTRLNQQINEIAPKRESEERIVKGLKDEIAAKQKKVAPLETQLQQLREKWTAIEAEIFHDTTEDVCYACGRPLDADKVQETRTMALANFNQSKAERLLEIDTKGMELRAEYDKLKAEILNLNTKLSERPDVGDDQFEALTAERDAFKKKAEDYTQIPGRAKLLEQKADLEKQIDAAKNGVSQDKDATQEGIDVLEAQVKAAKAIADRFPAREEGEARIQELKAEERKLAKEFEELEHQLFLIESFTRRKASLMDERINTRFQIVHFKLFNELISGGIDDCCEITVGGVPFNGGLNNAARMQGGCEIITVLQEHYGVAPVMWLDNRESVSEIPEMKCQVISLFVSPEDKTLRVEKSSEGKRAAA